MSGSKLQTEFEFTLPQGYVDDQGTLHKEGRMRLATAADEIEPLRDSRVQQNSSYLTIILLSRVVTDLGSLDTVNTAVIENLFVQDLEYLQGLYERINNRGANVVGTTCPECGEQFDVAVETGEVSQSPMTTAADVGAAGPGAPADSPGAPEGASEQGGPGRGGPEGDLEGGSGNAPE